MRGWRDHMGLSAGAEVLQQQRWANVGNFYCQLEEAAGCSGRGKIQAGNRTEQYARYHGRLQEKGSLKKKERKKKKMKAPKLELEWIWFILSWQSCTRCNVTSDVQLVLASVSMLALGIWRWGKRKRSNSCIGWIKRSKTMFFLPLAGMERKLTGKGVQGRSVFCSKSWGLFRPTQTLL